MKIITRLDAISIGQPWFFTGKECKNGHISKIGVKRWNCYECSKKIKKDTLLRNGDKIREQGRASYRKNFEKIAEKAKNKYEEIKDERKIYLRDYYKKNREKLIKKATEYSSTDLGKVVKKNTSHRRRAIEKVGDVDSIQLFTLQTTTKICYWCGISLKNTKSHIDHYIPLSKGGLHTLSNLVVSCSKCNLEKSAKDPIEFAQSLGKLL